MKLRFRHACILVVILFLLHIRDTLKGNSYSLLFDKNYTGNIAIAPYEPEL